MKRLIIPVLLFSSTVGAANLVRTSPGLVRFAVRTDPNWDRFTQAPSPDMKQWFLSKAWRMMVYSPYWDQRISWYPNAWVHVDLCSIPVDSKLVQRHPKWILKDAAGNSLYIPNGCQGGSCPEYAANIADRSYHAYWIAKAKHDQQLGYKGLWVDDVNLDYHVTDGNEKQVAAINPRTRREISDLDWKRDVAEFCEQIRRAFPTMEIVHNVSWFSGGKARDLDKFAYRELASADYINLERGFVNKELHGVNGEASLNALLSFIDQIHRIGCGVVLDNLGGHTEYALASFLLISSGVDAIGDHGLKPDRWWPGLDVDLGNPVGPRESWQGLLRRKFARGVVLVNPPSSSPIHIKTAGKFRRANAVAAETALTIQPADGLILVGPTELNKSVDTAIKVLN
jgi:hypothetical protein